MWPTSRPDHRTPVSVSYFVLFVTHTVARDAYSKLLDVGLTREDVRQLVDYVLASAHITVPIDKQTDGADIPLEPLDDETKAKLWWHQGSWQAIKNRTQAKDTDANSPIISIYMVDKHGNAIPDGEKTALRRNLYSYWNELFVTQPGDLRNHGDLSLTRKEHFRRTFEEKAPWLRLCEAHWKVDQLWVSYFSSWKRPRTTPDPKTKEPSPAMSASADKATSPAPEVRSKRRLEEEGDAIEDPSKRHKGKGKDLPDLMAPTPFQHSRPQSRKKAAKMARVCPPSFLLISQHTNNTQDKLFEHLFHRNFHRMAY